MVGPNPAVNAVFDGASCLLETGRTVANSIGALYNCVQSFDNPAQQQQNAQALYSRRNDGCGYGIPQAPQAQYQISYQPAPYPWANTNPYGQSQYQGPGYMTAGFNQAGYPGISNPGYGKNGFIGGGGGNGFNYNSSFVNPQVQPPQQTLPQLSGTSWTNGIWG